MAQFPRCQTPLRALHLWQDILSRQKRLLMI